MTHKGVYTTDLKIQGEIPPGRKSPLQGERENTGLRAPLHPTGVLASKSQQPPIRGIQVKKPPLVPDPGQTRGVLIKRSDPPKKSPAGD